MKNIEFVKAVYSLKEIPKNQLPALVLCGRSNVGKSSFINSLFNGTVAKTSSQPGKTRSLNYYLVEKKFYIVDLPGFGYAKVSKTEREKWQKLITDYFSTNENIKLAFHIIDSRHHPTDLDILLHDFIRSRDIAYCTILNKIDKLNQSELSAAKKEVINYFPELLLGENLFTYSSIKGTGKKEVVKHIVSLFM